MRWLNRISRRHDELRETMGRLMTEGVKLICTLNGMEFDGATKDPMLKAARDAALAFMQAQDEADYLNRREIQARGIASAKATDPDTYAGRPANLDAADVNAWRAVNGASINQTAEHFGISAATVAR